MILRKAIQSTKRQLQTNFSNRRNSSSTSALFIAGHGWTGAFGTGPDTITSAETSDVSPDDRDNNFRQIMSDEVQNMGEIVDAAAGWGHTALICKSNNDKDETTKLYVAGRPYDFQSLLRLYRLPSFIRRNAVSLSLRLDEQSQWGLEEKVIDKLSGRDENKTLKDYRKSILPYFEEIKLPDGDMPQIESNHQNLAASAGVTAVIGKSGKVYTFGSNRSGQCGVGDKDSIHIWEPTPIDFSHYDETQIVTDVALGLQHGLVLKEDGCIYTFGKGTRGQLGISDTNENFIIDNADAESSKSDDFAFSPVRVKQFAMKSNDSEPLILSEDDSTVLKIGAGWNHSVAVTKSNHAWIWGKNVLIESSDGQSPKAIDSLKPVPIQGLPNLAIVDISCGSHHTSALMEDGSVWATGISSDTNQPVGGEIVIQIIPPGIIDMPIIQFKSHFDRTTIVAGVNGQQILEVQLWSNEELRQEAVFEPAWVESISASCDRIKHVHRGWLHTVVVGQT